jgi:hypothetical protein
MPAVIKVLLTDTQDGELNDRFRNLGEDIYRSLSDSNKATVDLGEIDRCWDYFFVRSIRTRYLGDVTQMLRQLVRRHNFDGLVVLQRVD